MEATLTSGFRLSPHQLQTDLCTSLTDHNYFQTTFSTQSLDTAFIGSLQKDPNASDESKPSPPTSPEKPDSDHFYVPSDESHESNQSTSSDSSTNHHRTKVYEFSELHEVIAYTNQGAGKDLDRRQKEDLVFSDKTAKLKQLYTAGGTSRTLTTNSILYPAKTNSDPIITDTITTEEAADSDSAKSEDGLDCMTKMMVKKAGLDHYFYIWFTCEPILVCRIPEVTVVVCIISEIWGALDSKKLTEKGDCYFEKLCKELQTESIHSKICKFSLGVGKRSTNMAVIGELGRYPLFIEVIVNMFSYLSRLTSTEDQLLSEALLVSKSLSNHSKKSWFNSINSLAKYLDIDLSQVFNMKSNLKRFILNKLKLKYNKLWYSSVLPCFIYGGGGLLNAFD
ncbi:unnamed protein product [Mytilus edulis]|uniref:Uncharacterized protein n=1 Tax=Mytilus edulis TaxID=6550 RepID=A0A8S3SQH5_MYTED|nr:unnamed protein product [Mytilus edulis]